MNHFHFPVFSVLCAAAVLAACASASLSDAQRDARTANREMVLATAALGVAYDTLQTPALSDAVKDDIKAAALGIAGGIKNQVAVLQSGGSVTSQIAGALSGAVGSALPNLGAILKAAHGSTANPEEIAMAAGESAFSQAPAIAVLIADDLDPNWSPTDAQIKADADALATAAARFPGP